MIKTATFFAHLQISPEKEEEMKLSTLLQLVYNIFSWLKCPDNGKKTLGGGGDSNIKKVGMLVENFEIDP